jgi:hypothetical protein
MKTIQISKVLSCGPAPFRSSPQQLRSGPLGLGLRRIYTRPAFPYCEVVNSRIFLRIKLNLKFYILHFNVIFKFQMWT